MLRSDWCITVLYQDVWQCQSLWLSVKPLLKFGDLSIFKLVSVSHLGFLKKIENLTAVWKQCASPGCLSGYKSWKSWSAPHPFFVHQLTACSCFNWLNDASNQQHKCTSINGKASVFWRCREIWTDRWPFNGLFSRATWVSWHRKG